MPIYAYSDATTSLNARLGHRTDLTNTRLGQWIDQAQYIIATNVRALPMLEMTSPPLGLVIGQYQYTFNYWPSQLTQFWALRSVHNDTDKILMQRAEFSIWTQMPQPIQDGIPTQWCRYGNNFNLFQAPTKSTSITMYYRRIPTPGALELGDEWFDHIVQLAQYFALTEIGKFQMKQSVLQILPQQIQLALSHPLTPLEWEASYDEELGVQPWRG